MKRFRIAVTDKSQLSAVKEYLEANEQVIPAVSGVEADYTLLSEADLKLFALWCKQVEIDIYLIMPSVLRKRAVSYCDTYLTDALLNVFAGFYLRNIDTVAYMNERIQKAEVTSSPLLIADYSLYTYNHASVLFLKEQGIGALVAPYELNVHEWNNLCDACDRHGILMQKEVLVYGHIPFMQSAGCIKKTFGKCDHICEVTYIKDRIGKDMPVINNCKICENTVYNSVPLDLTSEAAFTSADHYRISFSVEKTATVTEILDAVLNGKALHLSSYTKGHYKKGVE